MLKQLHIQASRDLKSVPHADYVPDASMPGHTRGELMDEGLQRALNYNPHDRVNYLPIGVGLGGDGERLNAAARAALRAGRSEATVPFELNGPLWREAQRRTDPRLPRSARGEEHGVVQHQPVRFDDEAVVVPVSGQAITWAPQRWRRRSST
jgi:hypothetical protein